MDRLRIGYLANKNWFILFSIGYAIFIGLPFLAPVLMELELTQAANLIYSVYKLLCHQLPQRSIFLFGEETMYSLTEIQSNWQLTTNPLILRKFIGNPQMGWKVAWSDRMVSMYTSILLISWIWYPLRNKIKSFPLWGFGLLLLPMALDGITHVISDFSGIGQGFRDSNLWLAQLTNFRFQSSFYAGDALGSFNSWMRLFSGITFGAGVVLFGFPYVEEIFEDNLNRMTAKQEKLERLKDAALREIMELKTKQTTNSEK
jgi:uncharacterized membrane protein